MAKWKLLASAPGNAGLMDSIARFYCGEEKELRAADTRGTAAVNPVYDVCHVGGEKIEGVRVIRKGERARFEMRVD